MDEKGRWLGPWLAWHHLPRSARRGLWKAKRPPTRDEAQTCQRYTAFLKGGRGLTLIFSSSLLGIAAVLLASEEWAALKNLPVSAYLTFCKVAAVNFVGVEGLLMAPAYAVSDMLNDANLQLQDFDFYEIHEAFASQTIATLKAWQSEEFCRNKLGRNEPMGPIDLARLNTKGGSIAIGHPFAATGARIVATMAKLLHENGSGRGLISVCTAGGMGVTAIMEAP